MYRRACAVFVMVLMVLQLFHFEQLPGALIGMGLPDNELASRIIAMALVSAELAALPYLIGMQLRRRVVQVSRYSVLATGLLWVLISAWGVGSGMTLPPAALLGTTLDLVGGQWLLWFSLLLALLLACAACDLEALARRFDLSKRR